MASSGGFPGSLSVVVTALSVLWVLSLHLVAADGLLKRIYLADRNCSATSQLFSKLLRSKILW
jgi:hypothetical protein